MDDFEPNPEVDEVFSALRHPWRRWVLSELTTDPPLDLKPLAQHFVSSDSHESETDYRRVYLSLLHIHLPKLQQSGLIQYDPETKQVHPGERYEDELDAAIEELESIRRGPEP